MKEKKKEQKKLFPKIRFQIVGRKKKEKPKEIEEKPKEEIKEEPKEEPASVEEEPVKKEGLTSQIRELNEKLETITKEKKVKKKLKKKQFKLPFAVKSQLKKMALKNKVQVMLLQSTRNIKPVVGELKDGMLIVGDKIYEGSIDYLWLWNAKYPTVILPEWDLSPIKAAELYKNAVENKRIADPQTIIIRNMEFKEGMNAGKKISPKAWIWIAVLGLIATYVIFSQPS